MPDKSWKRTERRVAGILGGKRLPVNGRAAVDIAHPWLAPEVKHRKQLPAWLKAALDQARSGASSEQLPIVVLHQAGDRHAEDAVIIRLSDFQEWFVGTPHAIEDTPCTKGNPMQGR